MSYVISLTGGIGCGKSTVSDFFLELGADVVDADVIAHQISEPGQKGYDSIIRNFGNEYLQKNQTINRQKLGNFVFSNPNALNRLENILHPIIQEKIHLQVKASKSPYLILSIPLLFEKEQSIKSDRVLVIDCSPSIQIDRVRKRSKLTTQKITKILKTQVSRTKRLYLSDDVISNDNSIDDLLRNVKMLDKIYRQFSYYKKDFLP